MVEMCGGCFQEDMKELVDTHPSENGVIGHLCTNCNRVYFDEVGDTKRADVKPRTWKGEEPEHPEITFGDSDG